jgi:hypothetical protein
MNTVVVTTCSLNHLAQAKGLADSLMRHNPGYKLVIGLVDRLEGRVPAAYYLPYEVTEAHTLNIPEFPTMCERYTPLELNCAMKAFFCDYALKKHQADKVIFMDSDMLVFQPLHFLEEQLQQASILLSPHITSPYPNDGRRPFEKEMLKNGVFNAGFFAFRNDVEGLRFLTWLKQRMIDQCYVAPKEGLNADQTWFNLVPLFFRNVMVLQHPGCNAAYWNLHERTVAKSDAGYVVNGTYPLLFFHFSGYSLQYPQQLSRHQDRILTEQAGTLPGLLQLYHDTLLQNKHLELLKEANVYQKSTFGTRLKKLFKM